MSKEVFIVDGSRTPMGGLAGSLSTLSAVELGSHAIKAAVKKANIDSELIDEVFMGNVLSAGLKQGPARQASLNAGLPEHTGCVTINKLCGSGMQAMIMAHDSIVANTNHATIAGGMESMTQAPHLVANARTGVRTGHAQLSDHMFIDGLEDARTGRLMGSFAQETASQHQLTREQMDEFAISSLNKARNAIETGLLSSEISPITLKTRRGEAIIKDDEQPLKAKIEKIPSLRPAFDKAGTITAANASSISDGASALVLASKDFCEQHKLKALARIVGHARHSQAPSTFTLAPIGAMKKLLTKVNWQLDEVDLFEINEAFAMVTMLATKELGLNPEIVNIYGGACAQGHPVGSTGSRIVLTLINALQRQNKKRGVASLCIGGGEATAMAIELL